MPTIEATGPYMRPLAKLAEMLAAAPSVQARFGFTGLTNAEALTLEKIIYPALEDDEVDNLVSLLPVIVLGQGDKWALDNQSGGAMNYLRPALAGNSIAIMFADTARYEDMRSMVSDFGNWLGEVFKDLAAKAALDDNLSINGIRRDMKISVCTIEQQAAASIAYMQASFWIDWQ